LIVRDGSINDPDGITVKSIAVVGTSTSAATGIWQYRIADEWLDFDAVSPTRARLFTSTARFRFVPNADYNGPATLSFRAWDQTVGTAGSEHDTSTNGGTSAFSFNIVTATLTVQGVNDAPVLDPIANHTLTAINEDKIDSVGDTVGGIVQTGSITDIDGPVIGGIAIVAVDTANGTWQHSTDGTSWAAITASTTSALLLSPQRRVRFVPNASFHGTASFSFRAWDQSTGTIGGLADTTVTGGTSAFSTVQENAFITVVQVDDPPTLNGIPAVILDTTIASHDVDLTGISDGDEGNEVLSIVATSDNHDVLPDPTITYSSPDTTGTLHLAPIATEPGSALVTVIVREADGDSFTRTFLVSIGEDGKVWQNPLNPRDVDNSGFVVPLDVLIVINELNNPKFRDESGRLPLPPPEGSPPPYLDVNGDAHVTPLDALIVINFVNNPSNGEGEAATDQAFAGVDTPTVSPSLVLNREESAPQRTRGRADYGTDNVEEMARYHPSPTVTATIESSTREQWFAGWENSDEDLLLEIALGLHD
jgi:hypothetical protein